MPSPPLVARRRLAEAFGAASLDAFGSFTDAEAIAAALALDYVRATQAGALPRLARPAPQGRAGRDEHGRRHPRQPGDPARPRRRRRSTRCSAAVQRTLTAAGARTLAGWLAAPLTDPDGDRGAAGRLVLAARQPATPPAVCAPRCAARRTWRARWRGCRSAAAAPRDLAALRDGLARPRSAAAAASDGPLPAAAGRGPGRARGRSRAGAAAGRRAGRSRRRTGWTTATSIRPGFDGELDAERALRDDSRRVLAQMQLDYAQRYGVASLKIRHHAQLGYVIEAPAAAVEKLRDFPELTLRQGMANGARFTTPELAELDRRISEAGERAAARERAVFAHLVATALAQADALAACADALALLDVAQSAAQAGRVRHLVPARW